MFCATLVQDLTRTSEVLALLAEVVYSAESVRSLSERGCWSLWATAYSISMVGRRTDAVENSNMKKLALGVLLTLAFAAQGLAILRPPYPAKPTPPYPGGHFIRIGDDARSQNAAKTPN